MRLLAAGFVASLALTLGALAYGIRQIGKVKL